MEHLRNLLGAALWQEKHQSAGRRQAGKIKADKTGSREKNARVNRGTAVHKPVRRLLVMQNAQCYRHCLHHIKALGIKPVKTIPALHAILCYVYPKADLSRLQKHSMVKRVEHDRRFRLHVLGTSTDAAGDGCASITTAQVTPWGIAAVRAPKVWRTTKGGRVKVAVLDTGISAHPDLLIAGVYNAINRKNVIDNNGHGTHVAGTIAAIDNRFGVIGAAPAASLYAVKAFNKGGFAYTSDIIEGIDWCIRNRMHVINMSFGQKSFSRSLQDMIRRAYRSGIVMITSGGNSGPDNIGLDYPARFPETVAVGAISESGRIAGFSSRGKGIDLCAPGVNICSTYPERSYKRLNGTSMAAPHATAVAALLLSRRPRLKPEDVRRIMQRSASPLRNESATAQGSGLIQADGALRG